MHKHGGSGSVASSRARQRRDGGSLCRRAEEPLRCHGKYLSVFNGSKERRYYLMSFVSHPTPVFFLEQ